MDFVLAPNYLAVVVEGAALPLVHTAWLTATVFTVVDAFVLRARLRAENAALRAAVPTTADAPGVFRPARGVRPEGR